MREIYRALSLLLGLRAASRGPEPLAKFLIRRRVHRDVARTMRRAGL
jgi:hypothetical protein